MECRQRAEISVLLCYVDIFIVETFVRKVLVFRLLLAAVTEWVAPTKLAKQFITGSGLPT